MGLRVMTWNLWWHFGPSEARQPLIIDGQIGEIRRQAPELGQDNTLLLSREQVPCTP